MANISIDWPSGVIFIPKDYCTLVQSSPTEIRELNTDQFRMDLKALEASDEGMPWPKTHDHYPVVSVGGIELAMVVNISSDYTITFEDGPWAVNLKGSNNNILDRTNKNQVSVNPGNSAGLITNSAIEYSSFNGGVTVDVNSSYSGTIFPVGTPRQPVNNLTDALLIATYRGFEKIYVRGDITLDYSMNLSGLIFEGESPAKTNIHIASDANVENCEFYQATIDGILDGNCYIQDCSIGDLNYIYGRIVSCMPTGTITAGGLHPIYLLDCWGATGLTPFTIDLNGAGQDLHIRNFSGDVLLTNKTGTEEVTISLSGGYVRIDDTVTNGSVYVGGIGQVFDGNNNLIKTGTYHGVYVNTENLIQGSDIHDLLKLTGHKVTKSGDIITIYDDDGTTVWRQYDLANGGRVQI